MSAQEISLHEKMLTVELLQLRKAAELMAEHILAQPAVGLEQVSEVRMVASQVMAARGTGSGA